MVFWVFSPFPYMDIKCPSTTRQINPPLIVSIFSSLFIGKDAKIKRNGTL